ncbi:PDZ domain-containing protein [Roseateles sp. DAIF2]|uniref:S41 family peptidase n=1 Tax=Roseateles sp. DAIF2 TaxID=2714952 RepID=UPI0018A2BE09|nr:S41 family peptidase [Roseateles sp. DAIF2]QPF71907.1 PDZ domain-containing protein [Roseateles sp. DAIF2]
MNDQKKTLPVRRAAAAMSLLTLALLQACGGGGGSPGAPLLGNGGSSGSSGGGSSVVTPPVTPPDSIVPSASVAQQCAPGNPQAPAAQRNASLDVEKRWIRAYMDEDYLWREQVPQISAGAARYSGADVQQSLVNYFYDLHTPQRTASGAARDRFSFMIPESEWKQLTQAGVSQGYGLEWTQAADTPPRGVRVAYVEAGGPADRLGLKRGDRLLAVDGISIDSADTEQWRQVQRALYPGQGSTARQFRFEAREGGEKTLSLSPGEQRLTPVPQAKVMTAGDGAKVGYLVFHDHNLPAEAQLQGALQQFAAQGVSDLVLDLRYNGGGYLFIASQLAYMVAGPGPTAGRVFERLKHNSRRQADNEDSPFEDRSCRPDPGSFQCGQRTALPSLNLRRVYVLTQSGTCSASESLINGLRGVDVEVVQIGGRSCGKPYGFSGRENCGYRYMAIEFEGVNAKGFGDYADGFAPGCEVADDLGRELGDPQEAQLAAALAHRQTGRCPAPRSAKALQAAAGEGRGPALRLEKPWPRSNRLLDRP